MARRKTSAKVDYATFDLDIEKDAEEFVARQTRKIADDAPKNKRIYARGIVYEKNKIGKSVKSFTICNRGKEYYIGHILEYGSKNQRPQIHYRKNVNEKEFIDICRNVEIIKK